MLPIVLTILFCVIDVLACVCLLVLLMASMPNSSPSQLAQIKGIMWFVAACGLAIPIAIIALCVKRLPSAMLFSVLPMLGCLVALMIAWDVSKYQVSPETMPSIGRLVARVLVLLIFGGGGLVMFYVGAREWIFQRTVLSDSITVPATIVHSEVKTTQSRNTKHGTPRDDSTITHDPEVRFRYELDGKTYESDLLRPSAIVRTYASKRSAQDELAPFPLGAMVQAHVNRAMPGRAFLVKDASAGPIVFLILGFMLTPIALVATRLV
jgi:hypothetical protein